MAKKEAEDKRKVARVTAEHVGLVLKQGRIAAWCRKDGKKKLVRH